MDQFLRRVFGLVPQENPSSENPDDYPRKVEITDDESLMAIAKMKMVGETYRDLTEKANKIQEQLNAVVEEMRVSGTKYTALKTELFFNLKKLYPGIATDAGGHGWRRFGEQFFYVGWDDQPPQSHTH